MTTYTEPNGVTYTVTRQKDILGNPSGLSTVTIKEPDGTIINTITGVPNGTVNIFDNLSGVNNFVTGSSNLNILGTFLGNTYVSTPGSTGNINIGVSFAAVNTYVIGGNTDINVLASGPGGNTVDVYGGTASFSGSNLGSFLNGSTINLGGGGTFSAGSGIISVLSGSTINFTTGGGTFIANAGGNFIDLSGTTITNFENLNNGLNHIQFQNMPGTPGSYQVTNNLLGTQTIEVFDSSGKPMASFTVNGQAITPGTFTAGTGPLTVTDDGSSLTITDLAPTCFLSGTMIRTDKGEVAVEDLSVGDRVLVYANGENLLREVIWTGSRHMIVDPNRSDDLSGYPVCIQRGAIAENVPYKDFLLTSEHCLFLGGKLVPVRTMVNGRTIYYDRTIVSYTYHHVETEQHSILYSDGMLTESYLDTGNRKHFSQNAKVVGFPRRSRDWIADAAAPLEVTPGNLEPVFRAIEARAIEMGVVDKRSAADTTDDAGLHLVTDKGRVICPVRRSDDVATFMLPSEIASVRIVSRTFRPSDVIGPFHDDRRNLGLLIGEIRLQDGAESRVLDAHLAKPNVGGWHRLEPAPARWTNGNAFVDLGERLPDTIGVLAVRVLGGGPYILVEDVAKLQRKA
ncbi:Hint domain-containing protein [Labrys okinawensis]|uniref:Hint domain-containing protein n=1 Tax=Labrys okinawensis TaxID=346911 RepID=UPI0039BC61DD